MPTAITMPKLGLTMTEGIVIEWKKKEGEEVEKGEILYVLETEKVTFEVEATESGILGKVVAREGDVVPVGGIVGYILQPGEKPSDIPEPAAEVKAETPEVQAPTGPAKPDTRKADISKKAKISPLAKKIAEEHNIDITAVEGTGPDGRVVKEDVLRAVEEGKTAVKSPVAEEQPADGKQIPLSSMRRTIARRMTESFQTIPHFWVHTEADATGLIELQKQQAPLIEKETGIKLTYTDLLVKIVAAALKEHPNVNASWTDAGIRILSEINIGIAIDIPGGLIVPVIRRADEKSLAEIAAARADLVTSGREGKVNLDDMKGGTFTLNNVGALGIKCIDAIINPPESAILTVGRSTDRAVVIQGEITVRPVMDLSLGVDHRTLDGASGGRFLHRVKELIEDPVL